MGFFDDMAESSRKERLVQLGYSKDEAEAIIKQSVQVRQRKQLRDYEKHTRVMRKRLKVEYGKEFPEEPPVPGRKWGLWDVFDLFYVLEYPIFNAMKHALEGDDVGEVMRAVGRGLALQEKTSGDDLLAAFGVQPGHTRSIAGFLLSIAANPLNLFGGPLGLTKLGQVSAAKTAGALEGVAKGSKAASSVMALFPKAKSLGEAIKVVPELAPTLGGRAALGQSALLSIRGTPLIKAVPVMEMLGKFGVKLQEAPIIGGALRLMGHVSSTAHKRVIDQARWNMAHGLQQIGIKQGEIDEFLSRFPPEMTRILVGLSDDPVYAAYNAIAEADRGVRGAVAAKKYIGMIRRAGEALKKPTAISDDLTKAIGSTLRAGLTDKDADAIMGILQRAVSPTMGQKLHINNKLIRKILRTRKEDITFNPHYLDEYFKIIDPSELLRKEIGKAIVDEGSTGWIADALAPRRAATFIRHVDKLTTVWESQATPAMKEMLHEIVEKAYARVNVPGPLGSLIAARRPEAEVFAVGMRMFARDPAHVLAQSPDLFFLYQSLARFAPEANAAKFAVKPGLLTRASNMYQASLAVKLMKESLELPGSAMMSEEGKMFLYMLMNHVSELQTGKYVRGPLSRLYSLMMGDATVDAGKANMKSLFGQVESQIEAMVRACGKMKMPEGVKIVSKVDREAIAQLKRTNLLTSRLGEMLEKLGPADRMILRGRFESLKFRAGPLLDGKLANSLHETTKSFMWAKAFENSLMMYMTGSLALPNELPLTQMRGMDPTFILDALRKQGIVIPEEISKFANLLSAEKKAWHEAESVFGLMRTYLPFYLEHRMPEEALERLSRMVGHGKRVGGVPGAGGKWLKKLWATQHRDWFGTIDKINSGQSMDEIFGELMRIDPGLLYYLRGSAHVRFVETHKMLRKLASMGEELKAGTVLSKEELQRFGVLTVKGMGKKGGDAYFKLPRDVTEYVNSFVTSLTSHEDLQGFKTLWREYTIWNRGWTLGIFSAYHARNAVSNFYSNFVSGMRSVMPYILARRIAKWGPHLDDEVVISPKTGVKFTLKQFADEMDEWAVEGSGFFGAESEATGLRHGAFFRKLKKIPTGGGFGVFEKMGKRPTGFKEHIAAATAAVPTAKTPFGRLAQWLPLGNPRTSKLLAAGFAVGKSIENNARAAQYIFSRLEGFTPAESRARVAKYLFDYDDINAVVSDLRQWFPFIVWTRKNMPRQIENLVMHSSKIAPMVRMKETIEEGMASGGIDFPSLPEFIRENVPLAYRKMPDGTYQYFLLGSWTAVTDLQRIFTPFSELANMLVPGIRLPAELLLGKSFYFRTSLDSGMPGEVKRFLGIDMDPRVAHVLRSVRVLNETNRLLGLSDDVKETFLQRAIRATIGLRLYPVDPEQEMLRRYREYAEGLGRVMMKERYRREAR